MADKYEREFLSLINYEQDTALDILKKYMETYYNYGINTERELIAHAIKEYLYNISYKDNGEVY